MQQRKRLTFSMRSAIIAITCLAVPFSIYARISRLRAIAGKHHFASLDYGYRAAFKQIPPNSRLLDCPPALIKTDKETLTSVYDDWRMCIHHASLRDTYLSAAQSWWLPVPDLPKMIENFDPLDDSDYWNNTVLPFIAANPSLLYAVAGFPRSDPRNDRLNSTLLTSDQLAQLQSRIDSGTEYFPRLQSNR